jgi:hypothetical protein
MLLFSKFISYFLKYILKLQPLLNNCDMCQLDLNSLVNVLQYSQIYFFM